MMLGEAVSPAVVSAGKAPPGGGGFRNSLAGCDFSTIFNNLFASGITSSTSSMLLKGQDSAQGLREKVLSFFKACGGLGENPGLEEGAGQLCSERLGQFLEELLGEEFSFSGFSAQWSELPLPLKEQFLSILSILAGEVFGVQPQPREGPGPVGNSSGEGAFFVAVPEAGEYLKNLLQAAGLHYRWEGTANSERPSGFHPGDPFGQQSDGTAAEALLSPRQGEAAVAKDLFCGEKLLEQLQALQVDGEGAGGGEALSPEAAVAEALFCEEKPLEQLHALTLEGLKGQPRSGEEPFSGGETFKEKPVFSTLFGGGPQGEGMGNASATYVSSQASEILQFDSRDVMEQILQRMDFWTRQGEQELRLKLQPEFLGEVLIRMRRARGVLSAEIITGHPAVKEMLEGQLDTLRQRFQQMDLNVESFDVLLKDGGEDGFTSGREPWGDEPPSAGTLYGTPDLSGAVEEEMPFSRYRDGDTRVDYLV